MPTLAEMRDLTYVPFTRRTKKAGPTARARAKRRRAEHPVATKVREKCVDRDGFCRLMGLSPCSGQSEWAHLEEKKRARTRGMSPEERHTTTHSAMFCTGHHAAYDAGKILIAMTEKGADGPIRVEQAGRVVMC